MPTRTTRNAITCACVAVSCTELSPGARMSNTDSKDKGQVEYFYNGVGCSPDVNDVLKKLQNSLIKQQKFELIIAMYKAIKLRYLDAKNKLAVLAIEYKGSIQSV